MRHGLWLVGEGEQCHAHTAPAPIFIPVNITGFHVSLKLRILDPLSPEVLSDVLQSLEAWGPAVGEAIHVDLDVYVHASKQEAVSELEALPWTRGTLRFHYYDAEHRVDLPTTWIPGTGTEFGIFLGEALTPSSWSWLKSALFHYFLSSNLDDRLAGFSLSRNSLGLFPTIPTAIEEASDPYFLFPEAGDAVTVFFPNHWGNFVAWNRENSAFLEARMQGRPTMQLHQLWKLFARTTGLHMLHLNPNSGMPSLTAKFEEITASAHQESTPHQDTRWTFPLLSTLPRSNTQGQLLQGKDRLLRFLHEQR